MEQTKIEQKIVEYIESHFFFITDWDELKDKTFEEENFDSLDKIEGLMYAEFEFDIEILDSEACECKTFNDFAKLIKTKTDNK